MLEEASEEGNEDYIWALRHSLREADDWKNRQATPISDPIAVEKATRRKTEQYEKQTTILASLLPDEVIYNLSDYSKRQLNGCLLFGDVSGFTDLCEKYNKSGRGGPSRLTQVLNSYIGAMVQEILSYNGDVLKFSGDAFIALWKVSSHLSMRDVVHQTLDCALVIQKSYGVYKTDVGVLVRVKLAIANGPMYFSLIGDDENSHYLVSGHPIWDLKAAEEKSSAGEIVITSAAWKNVSPTEYISEELKDGMHIKVFGVGQNWRSMTRAPLHVPSDSQITTKFSIFEEVNDNDEDDSDDSINFDGETRNSSRLGSLMLPVVTSDEYSLRPAVNYAARQTLKNDLRRFILAPVMKSVDLDEPLEYLTEMRQVVVLLMNIVVLQSLTPLSTIHLANDTYKVVCGLVKNMHGCVNKVNNFDKDLMVLVIFGLRGFKHELESQSALKCATECWNIISRMKNVQTVSVGVTTGPTYCGVFGHALRREYTVISLTVNKAARLMVAYQGKVTCDRETFLHSKLEARNFILQPYKELKGIISPGPIYEFKEIDSNENISKSISYYPLLGREVHIKKYFQLLKAALNKPSTINTGDSNTQRISTFLIQGDARQGKTRLMEELVYLTPPKIPINRVTLKFTDYKDAYQALRLILYPPMGILENFDHYQREKKIAHRLEVLKTPEVYCFFNDVFGVNWIVSPLYKSLNKLQRVQVLKKTFQHLFSAVFVTHWIIGIDDIEYIDEDSWKILEYLMELKLVFIIATLGRGQEISENADRILNKPNVSRLLLSGVEKWYHIGLACQMLGVFGIPPELEKVIHTHSNGSPGWIESFVISLLQSGIMFVTNVPRQKAVEQGIVLAPLYMLTRMSDSDMQMYEFLLEERNIKKKYTDRYSERWKLYIESCRDSYTSLLGQFHNHFDGDVEISICGLNPGFNINDVDPELSMDVIILKTFDSLTSYEQLLLKCSSVLGDIFLRYMLMYIMSTPSQFLISQAVKKLFEIRVLCCARGNFSDGDLNVRTYQRMQDPNQDLTVKCECIGLTISDCCRGLPKYASCGYLRFRSSIFRETTYNLLTDNQKKEFHGRAVRYLEKETRKCRACGNGYFEKSLGAKNQQMRSRRKNKKNSVHSSLLLLDAHASFGSTTIRRLSALTNTLMPSFIATKQSVPTSTHSMPNDDVLQIDTDSVVLYKDTGFGFNILKNLKNNAKLIKTFSNTDFSQCQCALILNTMYSQMLMHCRGTGNYDKLLSSMLEYSYICLQSKNVPYATKILDEAFKLLDTMKDEFEMEWQMLVKKGKILTLFGYCLMELEQWDESYQHLILALNCYGFPFPTSSISKTILSWQLKLKQNIWLYICPGYYTATVNDDETEFFDNLSECLSLLCEFFMKMNRWDDAYLAALWSLNKAIESESDFRKLCVAYSNMIIVSQHYGKQDLCIALEMYALKLCHIKANIQDLEELKVVAQMYLAIFSNRVYRSELENAITLGYLIWRIGASTHSVSILLDLFPLLLKLLISRLLVIDYVNILNELDYYSSEYTDNTGKTWYYTSCLILQIEVGCTVQPYSEAHKFFQAEGQETDLVDVESKKSFLVLMWLWCIRNEQWENAAIWEMKTVEFAKLYNQSLVNQFNALYLLEGLILSLSVKMDKMNFDATVEAYDKITSVFKRLEKASKTNKMILPRLYHLKAFYKIVKFNDYAAAFDILKIAKSYAEKFGNLLEASWINHSILSWKNQLPDTIKCLWQEYSDPSNLLDYHEIEMNEGRVIHFTLEPPLYE